MSAAAAIRPPSGWSSGRGTGEFYFARFRVPLVLGALLLLTLCGSWWAVRRRDRAAEQEAEAEHLLAGAGAPDALPRRWVTLFWSQRSSIAEPLGRHGREQPHHRQRCRPMRFLSAGPQAFPAALRPSQCRGDSLLVQPLTDRARVYVNGERIDGEHRLQNNDTLRIGKTTLRLVL